MSYERAMPSGEQAAPENLAEMYANNKNKQENRFAAAKGAVVSGK
jgi:hypothetical protein